ncbi:hypothetical protein BRD04_09710 [Halobacteriales archaeon QS_9_67_17]|nr:MAG: hypothetical protein BRD04_09710 [Halobacteriales archaeon QS_9_67_17]
MNRPDRDTLLLAAVAAGGGLLVFLVATELFPYGSANHDEGVYLQQAELLLDGRLWFETPLTDAFRWWFFVEDGTRLYSKYQPVVPALFAVGLMAGVPRLVLAVVGAGVVGLVGLLTREAYDGQTALVASALVVASPLYLLSTSVFLPYAPTALLNLVFAYAYVRCVRDGAHAWGVVAGVAVGAAFFARPYTAVLFALPFIGHALWLLWTARDDRGRLLARVGLLGPVAALGVAFVAVTLAYNAVVTGDALLFPYQAFAPADGIGFGRRAILGYEREYTLGLAVEANAQLLWEFATRFVAAPPLGALAAAAGIGRLARRIARERADALVTDGGPERLSATTLRLLFGGVLVSVVVGNVAFWGNLNILADLSDPTDGFAAQFGPFYHYDLLLPLSAFGASGLAWIGRRAHAVATDRLDRRRALALALCVALVATPVVAVAEANALGPPVRENAAHTDRYANAYEPFADGAPEGVVFVPTPYGEWIGHPFQSLRNDPGLDGDTVFALDRTPSEDFAVLDTYPERDHYRFTYRGTWTAEPRDRIVADLQPINVRSGEEHRVRFETGVVGRPSTVRIADGDDAATYTVTADPNETFAVEWTLTPGRAAVTADGLRQRDDGTVTFDGSAEISLAVTYVQAGGATVTYRQEVSVEERGDRVRLVWPPVASVCRLTPDCGHEGRYVSDGAFLDGVSVNQNARSEPQDP